MEAKVLRLTVTSLLFLVLLTAFSTSAAQTLPPSPLERPQHLEPEPGEAPAWPGPGEPHGMGYLPTPPGTVTPSLPPMLGDAPSTAPAASVDLSAGMPPVQNQGSQGSCMAWSTGYYYKTYQEGIQHGWGTTELAQATNQRSPAYLYNQRLVTNQQLVAKCQMDIGWSFNKALAMQRAQGVDSMASFPYDQNDACTQPTPAQRMAAYPYRAADYGAFFTNPPNYGTFSNDITPLKQHLDSGDAFVIGIPVYMNFWTGSDCDYTAADAAGDSYVGGHAIAVVGYDDNHIGSDGYFKIINSWGTPWCSSFGYNGFAWLSYDFMQQYVAEAWWMTDIPWDTAPYPISLPMVLNGHQPGVTPPGIYGQITQNGTPVSGGLVELLRYTGSVWYSYRSTLTDANGNYRFTDAASLGGGTQYMVRYVNHTHTTGRVWEWMGNSFSTYTAGTDLNLGTYEVSDVVLDSPADPTASILPVTFQWTRRSFTSDDYELNIYTSDGSTWWVTSPTLGYANSYTLNSLASTGLSYATPYYWDLVIYTGTGIGWSLDAHTITFIP